jgi:hypothetical protein
MLAEGRASHNIGLEFADEVRRSLLKVALTDSVETYRSEGRKPHMVGICIPAIFLNKACLEDFKVMGIDNGTIGLFEVVNKKLKHPNLHFEPRLFFIPFHHHEKSRGNLGIFFSPWG